MFAQLQLLLIRAVVLRAHAEFLFKRLGKHELVVVAHMTGNLLDGQARADQKVRGFVHAEID